MPPSFRTALMRDFISDVHEIAHATDERINAYLVAQTTITSTDHAPHDSEHSAPRQRANSTPLLRASTRSHKSITNASSSKSTREKRIVRMHLPRYAGYQ
jgi:hypothetical protein